GNDLAASGTHARFQYRLNGGAWKDVPSNRWLTGLGDGPIYGVAQTVEFRACRDAGSDAYCGAASSGQTLTPVNARAALVSCTVGSLPTSTEPANAGSPTITLLYAYSEGRGGGYPDISFGEYSETEVA